MDVKAREVEIPQVKDMGRVGCMACKSVRAYV